MIGGTANETDEIEITEEMVGAAEEFAFDVLSGGDTRFLSEVSVALMLKAALEAGGYKVRDAERNR